MHACITPLEELVPVTYGQFVGVRVNGTWALLPRYDWLQESMCFCGANILV